MEEAEEATLGFEIARKVGGIRGLGVSTIDNSLILNNWENVGILGRSAVDFFRGGQ